MYSKISIIFLTVFIDLLGFGIVIPILPNYVISLGATTFTAGVIAGSFSLMNFVMTSYLGAWSDKIGRRPVLFFTVLMNALSYLLLAYSHTIWMILISRIIAGIGSANISVAQAYITDITPPEQRTRKMAIIGMAFGLGFMFGPPIGGYLKNIDEGHGITYVGLFTSALCFIDLLLIFFLLKESNTQLNPHASVQLNPLRNIKRFIQLPVVREYLQYGFIFLSAFSIFQVLSTIFWKNHCSLDDQQIGIFFGYIGLISILWQTVGLKILLKLCEEEQLIISASILMGVSFLSLIFLNTQNAIFLTFIILFFISMGNGIISPSITSLLSQKSSPAQVGMLLGAFQSLNSLARTIAPAIGGWIYDRNYTYPFISSSILMFISVFLILKVRNK